MNDVEILDAILTRGGTDAVVVTDDRLRIVRASAEAGVLASRPPGQLADLSLIAAFGSAALDQLARTAAADAAPHSGEASFGVLSGRDFDVDAVPMSGGGVLLWLHEVTVARRAAQARRDVVANISHELRTPLASIKLLAETIAAGAVADPQTSRDFAVQIQREVDHLAQLVNELLDLSTIESGETVLSLAPVAPDAIVANVAERIGPIASRREIRVRLVSATRFARVQVEADAIRLSQALLNLAHNAVKFSHHGGEVRLGWEATNRVVRLWVADDGIGIPAHHRERIFERFYKADRARVRGAPEDSDPALDDLGSTSAGLGLAIVRHIAAAHGGLAGFESQEGVGSTFWIEIPRAAG